MNSPNVNTPMEQHGGNLSWIDAHYPDAPKPLIDLSTGINPYGYPLPAVGHDRHYRLADNAVMRRAHEAAARYYGATRCVLASGMQPLMLALAALRLKEYGVSSVKIISPTYGEHERVWRNMGHHCHSGEERDDVVILCNPNNPDGRMFPPEKLLELAGQLAERECWLVVDESFADLQPGQSIAGHVDRHPNMVVLRSCGKFFGVAGLRVSAAIASEPCANWLRTMAGPWPVSTSACHLLPAMLEDNRWIAETRLRLAQEAQSWRALLAEYFFVAGYTDLFTLVEADHAGDWFRHLASHGVLVRRFDYNARWLRFGLPDAACLRRLRAALAAKP